MIIKTLSAAAIALALVGSAAANNTVLLTDGQAKSGSRSVGLDLDISDEASAFNFLVTLPKGSKNVDTSRCLSGLPKSHVGKCVASKDGSKVAVVVYSASNQVIPAGLLELGEIRYASAAKAGGAGVEKITLASPAGNKNLSATAKVVDLNQSENASNRSTIAK